MQTQHPAAVDERQNREARIFRAAAGALAATLIGFGLLQFFEVVRV